jgi:hypothetical protein
MRSFDHGYSRPFSVGWWATGPDGRLYRYREWYGCQYNSRGEPESDVGLTLDPTEIARGIYEREAEERAQGINVLGVCDPSLDDRSRGQSVMEMMAQQGVYFSKGDNARLAGKMQVHYRLWLRADGKPMMYVFKDCKDFIRLFPTLSYDEIKVEDVDTKSEDHIYDETRYRLMEAPIAATPPRERSKRAWNPLED